ncbi:MAG: metallophosphoesterase [Aureliella sp.]
MADVIRWCLFLVVLIGNCGFWLFCFNRANSTGLKRKITKRIEKVLVVLCFAIPLAILILEWPDIVKWSTARFVWPHSTLMHLWYIASLTVVAILGPAWLESRRWLWPPDNLVDQSQTDFDVESEIDGPSTGTKLTSFLNRLPGNDITQLSVTQKTLRLPRNIPGLEGLTIGHISDLHFTGQFTLEHYRFVLDQFQQLRPDIIAVTGDVIDYLQCLPWIEELLAPLDAPVAKLFVLGNHDRRLPDVSEVADRISALGFLDVGRDNQIVEFDDLSIHVAGNEAPWLERHNSDQRDWPAGDDSVFRLGLSHAPDQIGWAREHHIDLMLAGHTHGGQARFPFIGPIVAPSRYGSRFASGVFLLKPTLMHVSRGVAGTHPVRFRCKPEVSLLKIQ